jgi:hypothetical protein
MRQFILGSLLLVAAVIVAIRLAGGTFSMWLHPMFFWACFAVAVPFIALHTVWSRLELQRACAHAGRVRKDLPGALESVLVWRAAEGIAYVSGVLGLVTGLMITLQFLDRGGVGFKIAASLSPVFFGLVSAILFRILRLRVEHLQGGPAC